eukprot:3171882-Pleurochrysis_carterae.AAC.1
MGLGVRGERSQYIAAPPSSARADSYSVGSAPSSVASVRSPWLSAASFSAAKFAGLIDINCKP